MIGKPIYWSWHRKHHKIECPAKGKTCNFCKKYNHFSKVCRSRIKHENVQEVKSKEAIIKFSSDEEYAYTIKKETEHVSVVSTKTPKVDVTVNEKQCKFLLDTGATVNLLDEKTYHRGGSRISS